MSDHKRDDIIQDFTPYEATLAAMVFPWPIHALFNLIGALSLGLIGAPRMAAVWAVAMCLADCIGQRTYGRWKTTAAETDSATGLRRLAWMVLGRTALWYAAPVAYTLMSHSPAGVALVAIMAITTTALGISLGWTAWQIFLSMAGPALIAVAVVLVGGLGLGLGLAPEAGVLVAFASGLVTLTFIAIGTNKSIAKWSRANKRTIEVMAETQAALNRSEAAERRLKVAIGIANLHVYEMDYTQGVLTSLGAEADFYEGPLTYEQMRDDPYRSVAPEHLAATQAAWARYKAGEGPYRSEYLVRRTDGREVWAYASAEMIWDEAGNPVRLVGAQQNVTERKRGELELTEVLTRAEAASRAKSDFLATMSHEIRTPLNGVLGMAQVMERDTLSGDQRKRLEVIRQSGQSLLVLLNGILDLSKIEAGKLELEIGEVDIAGLAKASLETFAGDAGEKGLDLVVQVAPEAEGIFAGDGLRIGQVLHNLVSNAVKFTHEGSVTVAVVREDGIVRIEVTDTGIGVPGDQIDALFEKFSQADTSVTRRFGGTGLGLAICRELSAMMGGEVSAQSEEGRGSRFTVSLPLPWLRSREAPAEAAKTPAGAKPGPDSGAPLRVLAAEDNPVNRLVLRTLLEQAGIAPVLVEDGQQALNAWRAQDWDLILMDVQMPVMDGVTAAQAIRAAEAAEGRARTPIVALTANVMNEQVAAYRSAGMDDVVAKPIEFSRLLEIMDLVLGAHADQARFPVSAAAQQAG